MINLRDYDNFYFLTELLLLVNMLKKFRDMCLHFFTFYTSPNLSWQAALKMTDVELDFLTDIDQHLFINEGTRGGVAMISHRYARPNAHGMENRDASKRNSYIMYLDANILYGWVIPQPLPTSNFRWLTDKEMEYLNVMMVSDDSSRVCILECDLVNYNFYYLYIYV